MSEVELENLLDALSDALIAGHDDHAVRLSKVNSDLNSFTRLLIGLRHTLQPQTPSDRFMRQLKRDLTGQPQGMVARIGKMPLQVHVATGVAAGIAGLMWLSRRQTRPQDNDNADLATIQQGS